MIKPTFSANDFEVLDRQVEYQGFFSISALSVRHKTFSGAETGQIRRELFQRGSAVGVLLYDPAERLIGLTEQFRIGAIDLAEGPWLLELVAGMIEEAQTPEETALKELQEEAGIREVFLTPICRYLVSPGGTDEMMHLYCGITNLKGSEGLFGRADENEDIRFHVLPEREVLEALNGGGFKNAATVIALQWLALNKNRIHGGEFPTASDQQNETFCDTPLR
ncbi:MAG: NUDIX domain-containing protein [bacterium]